jgi:hypothetical protein
MTSRVFQPKTTVLAAMIILKALNFIALLHDPPIRMPSFSMDPMRILNARLAITIPLRMLPRPSVQVIALNATRRKAWRERARTVMARTDFSHYTTNLLESGK